MNALAALSPLAELWRWHTAHDLNRRSPPHLVERAINQHGAECAARTVSPLAESMLEEVAGLMVRHAERCAFNDRLGPRLEKIERHEDAERITRCCRYGRLVRRESDARMVPIPDEKCRRPRLCPHCARERAARARRRYLRRLLYWITEPRRKKSLPARGIYFMTVSPPPLPNDRLEWAMRELFALFDHLHRNSAGRNIAGALGSLEIKYSAPGLARPHLHVLAGAAGAVSYKGWRAELDRLLREEYAPIAAGDVLRRPATGVLVRVESVRYAPGAVRETVCQDRNGKPRRRFRCAPSRDIASLSDGSELSVAELRQALAQGDLAWAYRLCRRVTGRAWRVAGVRHVPGADRRRDVIVLESNNPNAKDEEDGVVRVERSLGELLDAIASGELVWNAAPMSFQCDFQKVEGNERQIEKSLRELVKYMVKHAELLDLDDDDLRVIASAGGMNFRGLRAYGFLHGAGSDAPGEAEAATTRPTGTYRYDPARQDVEVRLGGEVAWAREVHARTQARREEERRSREGLIDLIPPDRSAAGNKAHKSATVARALAAHGWYDAGTGPPPGRVGT